MIRSLRIALLTFAVAAAATAVHAQPYPAKPIRVIVPAGAGGAADVLARLVFDHMATALNTTAVIDNKGGAGGILGTEAAARAAPDGYTVLLSSNTLVITPSLYKTSYDVFKDLAPVGLVASAPNLLVASAELNVRSLSDLLAYAKRTPQAVMYGSPAVGSAAHLTVELLGRTAALPMEHVPFKGPQQALAETLAGRVPLTIAGVSNALPHMKSGKLVALAVTGSVRSNLAPEVPTFKEAGVSGVDVNLWFALFAPAGTPATIVTRLNEALNAALRAPAVAARLQALAFDPEGGTAAQLADAMRKEAPLYARIVREAGIKAD